MSSSLVSSSRCRFFFFSSTLPLILLLTARSLSFMLNTRQKLIEESSEKKWEGERESGKWWKWKLGFSIDPKSHPSYSFDITVTKRAEWRFVAENEDEFKVSNEENFRIFHPMETTWGWRGESGWTSELWRDDETAAAALVWEWECSEEVDEKYFVKMFCGCVCYYYGSQQLFLFLSYYVMFNFISEFILSFFDWGYPPSTTWTSFRICCSKEMLPSLNNFSKKKLLLSSFLYLPSSIHQWFHQAVRGIEWVTIHSAPSKKSRVRGRLVCTLSITHKRWWRFGWGTGNLKLFPFNHPLAPFFSRWCFAMLIVGNSKSEHRRATLTFARGDKKSLGWSDSAFCGLVNKWIGNYGANTQNTTSYKLQRPETFEIMYSECW